MIKKPVLLVLLLIPCLLLCACGDIKSGCTYDDFLSLVKAGGYEYVEHGDELGAREISFTCYDDGYVTDVSYREFESVEDAKNEFLSTKGALEGRYSSISLALSSNTNGQELYKFNSEGRFFYLSRVGNALFYGASSAKNRSVAEDFFESFGF